MARASKPYAKCLTLDAIRAIATRLRESTSRHATARESRELVNTAFHLYEKREAPPETKELDFPESDEPKERQSDLG